MTGVLPFSPEPPVAEDAGELLDFVARECGVDLREHRPETIGRRLALRIAATGTGTADGYLAHLRSDPAEMRRLISTLLIPVTSFFRDPPVFDSLRPVLATLGANARGRGLLRAWIPGVATGEEAWSLAMLLAQECSDGLPFSIVASDLDAANLQTARRGDYPLPSVKSVPVPLREKFLELQGDTARVCAPLRRHVEFVEHDIVGTHLAPPQAIIASFDIVMFRNVLIYFSPRLQDKALQRLAAVVEPGGALVLGQAESRVGAHAAAFEPWPDIDPSHKIFRRRHGIR